MRRPNKKGFTIVELVIVIAVVAILAAVLIPTFVNVVNKANVSNDTALVKNINLTLATEEIDGKPATMHEALEMAERGGFDVSKLTPRSGGDIVWDSETNRFALVDKNGNKVFSENDKNVPKNASVWKIVDSKESAESEGAYSVYLKDGVKADALTVKTGIDVGNNTVGTVNYTGTNGDATIRTNGGNLVINGNEATNVLHYGYAADLKVKKVASSSYHEFGTIGTLSELEVGHIQVESTGKIINISDSAVKEGATITNNGQILNKGTAEIEGNNTVDYFAIGTAEELISFRSIVNSGCKFAGVDVKLIADIDLGEQNWLPIGNYRQSNNFGNHTFEGKFDGQNHTISGLFINGDAYPENYKEKDSVYGALFGYVANATVKNFTIRGKVIGTDVGGAIGALGENCTVDNVTSYVDLTGKKGEKADGLVRGKVAGIVICTKGDNSKISNCKNYGNITATNGGNNPAGGIIAYVDKNNISVENCENYGEINATQTVIVGGIVGGSCSSVTFVNCKNFAKVNGLNNVGGIAGSTAGIFTGCENSGKITGQNGKGNVTVGGIVGEITKGNSSLSGCKNSGSIIAQGGKETNFAGGLVGWAFEHDSKKPATLFTLTFENCENTNREITGSNGNCGGIIGNVWYVDNCNITNHTGEHGYKATFKNCKTVNGGELIGNSANANSYATIN